jgi:hypothetical protein
MVLQEFGKNNMPFVPDAPIGRFVPNAPEQGNMYTQSAQDIQYDANGIPLNTSSYGSGTTGGTDYARKALTTAAALPVNVATGVAKNAGGLAQTVNRYFGGDSSQGNLSKPEEFLNAINQIETGTQQQSGSPYLLKGASMVGQAAPYFATGGRIGAIPSFTKNVGQGALIGAGSALATPEEIGLTPEQFREAKNKNIAIQTTLGGAFPIAGEMVSKTANALRGTKLSPQMENAVLEARQAGYTVPPTQAGGGMVNRLLEGMAGKASTLQEASVRNQEVTNKLATKSLGLPEDTVLTPEVLSTIRDDAGMAYEALKALPKKPAVLADSTMNRAAVAEINPAKLVEDLKIARKDAEGYYNAYARSAHPEDLATAKAFKSKATEIENTLENYAKEMGQDKLVPALRDARQLIAKTYTVENAMNKTTGTIDAKEFAKRLQKGKPMSEELEQIGKFAQAFPKAAQKPEIIGGTIGISPLDYTVAGLTGGASLLGGNDKETTSAATLAALLARPVARKAVLSNRMQNNLVQQQVAPAGPLRQALPSYDEAQQLAKMLIMQRSGSNMENR